MSFFEAEQPEFASFVLGNAPLKKLATGFDWVEGPVWFGDHDCLLFSDIPNNRILRWSSTTGIGTFREPSNFANGNTRDREGRLVTCEHGTRRVTRTEFTAPADGEYRIEVRDLNGRGGPRFVYRLDLVSDEPDVALTLKNDRVTLTPGKPLEIAVAVDRRGGFDGTLTVTAEGVPAPIYLRFANGYAYATVQNSGALAKDRLRPPGVVFPAGDNPTASLEFNIDQIPEGLKELALGQLDLRLADAKEEAPPG